MIILKKQGKYYFLIFTLLIFTSLSQTINISAQSYDLVVNVGDSHTYHVYTLDSTSYSLDYAEQGEEFTVKITSIIENLTNFTITYNITLGDKNTIIANETIRNEPSQYYMGERICLLPVKSFLSACAENNSATAEGTVYKWVTSNSEVQYHYEENTGWLKRFKYYKDGDLVCHYAVPNANGNIFGYDIQFLLITIIIGTLGLAFLIKNKIK